MHWRFLGGGVGRVDDHGPLGAAAVFAAAGRLVALAASIPAITKRGHKGELVRFVGKAQRDMRALCEKKRKVGDRCAEFICLMRK